MKCRGVWIGCCLLFAGPALADSSTTPTPNFTGYREQYSSGSSFFLSSPNRIQVVSHVGEFFATLESIDFSPDIIARLAGHSTSGSHNHGVFTTEVQRLLAKHPQSKILFVIDIDGSESNPQQMVREIQIQTKARNSFIVGITPFDVLSAAGNHSFPLSPPINTERFCVFSLPSRLASAPLQGAAEFLRDMASRWPKSSIEMSLFERTQTGLVEALLFLFEFIPPRMYLDVPRSLTLIVEPNGNSSQNGAPRAASTLSQILEKKPWLANDLNIVPLVTGANNGSEPGSPSPILQTPNHDLVLREVLDQAIKVAEIKLSDTEQLYRDQKSLLLVFRTQRDVLECLQDIRDRLTPDPMREIRELRP